MILTGELLSPTHFSLKWTAQICGRLTERAPTSEKLVTGRSLQTMNSLLNERLKELHSSTPEIAATIIVSNDGVTMASALPPSVKESRVSEMTAVMLALGERISNEMGRGGLEQVYIKGKIGHVVLMSISEKAVLVTIARENATIGMLVLEINRTVRDLEKLI